jgi:hypothetical protein
MPKIRKQPKRTTKKIRIPSIRNPFFSNPPLLPQSIAINLSNQEKIIPRHLDDFISEPSGLPSENISLMKQALTLQE